eukprot:4029859-Prymnesium_polylepis.1
MGPRVPDVRSTVTCKKHCNAINSNRCAGFVIRSERTLIAGSVRNLVFFLSRVQKRACGKRECVQFETPHSTGRTCSCCLGRRPPPPLTRTQCWVPAQPRC